MKLKLRLAQIFTLLITCMIVFSYSKSLSTAGRANESLISKSRQPYLVRIPPSGFKPRAETEESRQGAELFQALNCMACHSIRNAGGSMGPILDAVGNKRTEPFIIAHLSNDPLQEQEFKKLSNGEECRLRPHSRITDKSSKLIAKYLLTLPEPPGGFAVRPHQTRFPAPTITPNPSYRPALPSASSREGAESYTKLGCAACHSIGNVGGWLGPKLDGVGSRLPRQSIVSYVTNAQAYALATRDDAMDYPSEMPQLTANPDEIQKIADFLMTLP